VLNYLADMDGLPLVEIDGAFIARLRDRIFETRKRRFANYCLAVLSVVMETGRELGYVTINPVKGVKRIRRRRDERTVNRPWTAAERATVLERAPEQLRRPLAIGRWTGLREGDVLRLAQGDYDGKTIRLRTHKRDVPAVIPVAKPLKAILDEPQCFVVGKGKTPPTPLTLCATLRGRPWTESGFRASLFKFLRALEEEGAVGSGLTFHGLRHSVATDLAELGYDDRTIADMLAQESEDMPAHYSKQARLERKLRGVVRKLEQAHKARRDPPGGA
jgi:integrase